MTINKPQENHSQAPFWADAFHASRAKLLALAANNLQDILRARFSPEDIVSATYTACTTREDYLANYPEVPLEKKFDFILLQTITDLERKHLKAKCRDAYKEVSLAAPRPHRSTDDETTLCANTDLLAAPNPSPVSQVDARERAHLVTQALHTLSASDQEILTLRHFKGLRNEECAAQLGLDPKATSIRYVRALKRLHNKLVELSCFRPLTKPKEAPHGD